MVDQYKTLQDLGAESAGAAADGSCVHFGDGQDPFSCCLDLDEQLCY